MVFDKLIENFLRFSCSNILELLLADFKDSAYAFRLLDHARRLYDFAYTYRGLYSDSITDAKEFYP